MTVAQELQHVRFSDFGIHVSEIDTPAELTRVELPSSQRNLEWCVDGERRPLEVPKVEEMRYEEKAGEVIAG